MDIQPQTSSAILECDHPMSPRERALLLAELQGIGIRAVILPVGVSLAGMTSCEIDDDAD